MQRLETDLGVRWLQRTTRRLGLTSTGQSIVDGTGPALAQLETVWHEKSVSADALSLPAMNASPSKMYRKPRQRYHDFLAWHLVAKKTTRHGH